MIARITRGSAGLSEYLRSGKRADDPHTRSEKDRVLYLYGDHDLFAMGERSASAKWKDSYLHITLSFSEQDEEKLSAMTEQDRTQLFQQMTREYMEHFCAGYDLENEIIAIAEAHLPKLKENIRTKKDRRAHIHIGILLENQSDGTKIRPPFFSGPINNDILQRYVNAKYGLSNPDDTPRQPEDRPELPKKIGYDRKDWQDISRIFRSLEHAIEYLETYGFEYRLVKTAKNTYLQLKNPDGKDLNLRGRGFEHMEKIYHPETIAEPTLPPSYKDTELPELEQKLRDYQRRHAEKIYQRRSEKSKERYIQMKAQADEKTIVSFKTLAQFEREKAEIQKIAQTASFKEFRKLNPQYILNSVEMKYGRDRSKRYTPILAEDGSYRIEIRQNGQLQKTLDSFDFLRKEYNLTGTEAFSTIQSIYAQNIILEKTQKIEIPEITIGYHPGHTYDWMPNYGWTKKTIRTLQELVDIVTAHKYTPVTHFQDGYGTIAGEKKILKNHRSVGDTAEIGNVTIIDIDNDPDSPYLSLKLAEKMLDEKGIAAVIIPSKSHRVEKHGHIADRYRIIIPMEKPLPTEPKEEHQYRMEAILEEIGLLKYADPRCTKDISRAYRESPRAAQPIITTGKVISAESVDLAIQKGSEKALAIHEQKEAEKRAFKEREHQRIQEFKTGLKTHPTLSSSAYLFRTDTDRINDIDLATAIDTLEGIDRIEKEGSSNVIYTKTGKKYVADEHITKFKDFKNDIGFTKALQYIKSITQAPNLYQLGREVDRLFGMKTYGPNPDVLRIAMENILESGVTSHYQIEKALVREFGLSDFTFSAEKVTHKGVEYPIGHIISREFIDEALAHNATEAKRKAEIEKPTQDEPTAEIEPEIAPAQPERLKKIELKLEPKRSRPKHDLEMS